MIVLVAVGCMSTRGSGGEYYDLDDPRTTQVGDRIYVDDPFYGRVILQRDPFTGRYYDISNSFGRFGSAYDRRYYNDRYRYYRYRNQEEYRRPAPRPDVQKSREETRRKILGENN